MSVVVITADDGQVITARPTISREWVIESQTLLPGQRYTLSDKQVISVAPAGAFLLDGIVQSAQILSSTSQAQTTGIAVLTAGDEVVTAYQVPSTTGLGVVDGTTLSYRGAGITLSNGVAISMGFDGIEDRTTTVPFQSMSAAIATISSTTTTVTTVSSTSGIASSFASSSAVTASTSITTPASQSMTLDSISPTNSITGQSDGFQTGPVGVFLLLMSAFTLIAHI